MSTEPNIKGKKFVVNYKEPSNSEITESSIAIKTNSLCKQAVSMAGGNDGFAIGWCGNSSRPENHWQCIINSINKSNKRGYSNDDVSGVINYAVRAGVKGT